MRTRSNLILFSLLSPLSLDLGIAPSSTLRYDYANRLVEVREGGQPVAQYRYDALGRRIEKSVNGVGTRFVYAGAQIVEESSPGRVVSHAYGLGIDSPIQRKEGALAHFLHADDMSSIVALTNSQGNVVERYEYGDYGKPRTASALGNRFLFTGREFDHETGLYHYRSRALDPHSGKFLQRDSIGTWGDRANRGSANAYTFNNPQTFVDPFGHERLLAADPSGLDPRSKPLESTPILSNQPQTHVERRVPKPPIRINLGNLHRLPPHAQENWRWGGNFGFLDAFTFGFGSRGFLFLADLFHPGTSASVQRSMTEGALPGFQEGYKEGQNAGAIANTILLTKALFNLGGLAISSLGGGTQALELGGCAVGPSGSLVLAAEPIVVAPGVLIAGARSAAVATGAAIGGTIAGDLFRSSDSGGGSFGNRFGSGLPRGNRFLESEEAGFLRGIELRFSLGVTNAIQHFTEGAKRLGFDDFGFRRRLVDSVANQIQKVFGRRTDAFWRRFFDRIENHLDRSDADRLAFTLLDDIAEEIQRRGLWK